MFNKCVSLFISLYQVNFRIIHKEKLIFINLFNDIFCKFNLNNCNCILLAQNYWQHLQSKILFYLWICEIISNCCLYHVQQDPKMIILLLLYSIISFYLCKNPFLFLKILKLYNFFIKYYKIMLNLLNLSIYRSIIIIKNSLKI